jgi:lysophospholipase L1-like esterase
MKNTLISFLLAGSFLLTTSASGLAQPSDPTSAPKALFRNNDRICLVGDSITHSGTFHSYIFLYYATRFPEKRITFMNCGISGDSASGMQQRLDWDVYAKNPTFVTLSAGMNDVNRSLYSQVKPPENAAEKQNEAIEKFKENIRQLASSFREHGLRTIFITPTLYDEDLDSPTENLRGVNAALGTCSDFILDFAKSQNAVAVDFWSPLNEISEKGKKADPAFTLTRKGHFAEQLRGERTRVQRGPRHLLEPGACPPLAFHRGGQGCLRIGPDHGTIEPASPASFRAGHGTL